MQELLHNLDMSRPTSFWLFLVFGEPLKKADLPDMLLQKCVAGGGRDAYHPTLPFAAGT